MWTKGTKIRPQTKFFVIFSNLDSIPFNDSLQQCLIFSGGKIHEKNVGGPYMGQSGFTQTPN